MDDKVVGRLWAQSYRSLGKDPGAAVTCRVTVKIVEIRARACVAQESWSDKINRALREFEIPEQQWNEFNQSTLAGSVDNTRKQ